MKQELTQESIRHYTSYDELTGKLKCRNKISQRTLPGLLLGAVRSDGYTALRFAGEVHLVHRLIWLYMTGSMPTQDIDHIDGKRSNNVWSNLRQVSRAENNWNRKDVSGTYWDRQRKLWHARIGINYGSVDLGSYATKEEAEAAYATYKLRMASTIPGSQAHTHITKSMSHHEKTV